MAIRQGVHYQGCLLDCEPISLSDGRFGARVSITSETGKLVIERGFPSLEVFSDERDAFEYAKRWGKAWIDDNE